MPLEDFYNDPKEFLKTNVVRTNGAHIPLNAGENPNRVYRLVLVADHDWRTVSDGTGTVVGRVYWLHRDDNAAVGIDAYYCPYGQSATKWVTLGTACPYMFTAQMDGCTFGIGNDADGALIVGHANAVDVSRAWSDGGPKDAGVARQRVAQRNALRWRIETNARYLEAEEYMLDKFSFALTFGVRRPDGWKFYTAVWLTYDLKNFRVLAVTTAIKGLTGV